MIGKYRNSRLTLLFALTLLAIGLPVLWIYLGRRQSSAPIAAPISTNLSKGWIPFGGAWRSNGPSIFGDSEDRGPKVMNGSLDWENYVVETDVRLDGSYGDAGVIIRSSGEEEGVDSYHGYFAGIRNMDNSFIFGRADFGWIQIVKQPIVPLVSGWYHLKFLAYGCSIAASVSNQLGQIARTYVVDPHCLPKGRFGLKSYETSAEWKNLRVQPSNASALQEMTQGLEPKVVNYNDDTLDSELSTSNLDQYMSSLRREAEQHQFNLEARPIGALQMDSLKDSSRAIVRGIVTLVNPAVYLQDSTGATLVKPLKPVETLRVGDEVEAQGTLSDHESALVLSQASLKILWPNSQIIPIVVTPFELASGRNHGRFVETEGVFLSQFIAADRSVVLKLEGDTQEFYAVISRDNEGSLLKQIEPGARLRLRGVASSDNAFTRDLVSFAILVPSESSIQVIGLPSWWTPNHIALALVALLLLAGVAHLILSYEQRWRHEAILHERERLALEIHDTLAQSFAGIAFQLQAVRADAVEDDFVRGQLDTTLDMVRRSHSEAKRSIVSMQAPTADPTNISDSLRQFAERLCSGHSPTIHVFSQGQPRRIPDGLAKIMLLVGQEAINNSIRHSGASQIDISLVVHKEFVQLSVKDNGVGFVADADSYGFGLRGMAHRAAGVSAQLKVFSTPGHGTTVILSKQLSQFADFRFRSWRWLRHLSFSGT